MIEQDKKHIRKQVRRLRRQLSEQQQTAAAQALAQRILARVKHSGTNTKEAPKETTATIGGKKVALFFSMDGEIGTEAAIEQLWQLQAEVYLPVIHPFNSKALVFIRYERDSELFRSPLGMLEPKVECHQICPLAQLDILFIPLVAFDNKGNRLGMGGGFYDRTLEQHYQHKHSQPAVIGLAHACQQVDQVPLECWDIPLKEIITDQQHFYFA